MAEFMEGTVDVPGAGRIKKPYILIPAGLAAVYVGYRWYQATRGDDSGDQAAGSDGMYTTDDQSEYGLSTGGGSQPITGNNGSQVTDGTRPDAIDSNSEWTQEAVEQLGNAGFDAATVYSALGEFLARRALDKTEASIARAALAAAGQPPIGGPYSVIEEAATGGTGTLKAPANLRRGATSSTSVDLVWEPVAGAMYYRIYRSGASQNVGSSADGKGRVGGLQSNTTYSFWVRAVGTTGKTGPESKKVSVKTNAVKLKAPTGLRSSSVTKSSFRVTCSKVEGAQYYRWYINGRSAGASDQPYRDFTGMKRNTTYKITARSDTNNQSPSDASAPLAVKTKK